MRRLGGTSFRDFACVGESARETLCLADHELECWHGSWQTSLVTTASCARVPKATRTGCESCHSSNRSRNRRSPLPPWDPNFPGAFFVYAVRCSTPDPYVTVTTSTGGISGFVFFCGQVLPADYFVLNVEARLAGTMRPAAFDNTAYSNELCRSRRFVSPFCRCR